jgi:glycosyltransferase involved in cell wall biosynthesis
MKTILASTYAVNPYKGSEDGMGWNFIIQIARFHKVLAITRENNKVHIEKYMKENPNEIYNNILFFYFDLPIWARFWKRGSKGALIYFYLWQKFLPHFIRKNNLHFDIVHNVNFHNDWTPSFLWKLNKPLVWGPIGHHPKIPSQYSSRFNIKYWVKEKMTWVVKNYFWNYSLSLNNTIKNAQHILCMNGSVQQTLKLNNKNYSIMPSVATQDFGFNENNQNSKFTIISAGRLVPLKGFDLTIKSFARFLNNQSSEVANKCELIIVGSGPELESYIELTKDLGIQKNVKFISWLNRDSLMNLFKESSLFVFPSHEGAGMVVAEALSFGLPVLCLDNCGPGEFVDNTCGIKVSYRNYEESVRDLAQGITKLFTNGDLLLQMRTAARKRFETNFNWDVRGEELKKIYSNI